MVDILDEVLDEDQIVEMEDKMVQNSVIEEEEQKKSLMIENFSRMKISMIKDMQDGNVPLIVDYKLQKITSFLSVLMFKMDQFQSWNEKYCLSIGTLKDLWGIEQEKRKKNT